MVFDIFEILLDVGELFVKQTAAIPDALSIQSSTGHMKSVERSQGQRDYLGRFYITIDKYRIVLFISGSTLLILSGFIR